MKVLFFTICFIYGFVVFSQNLFYQNTLKGRVTVRAFGIYDSSSVSIPIQMGDTINRAFLIATNMISPLKVTSFFNGHEINWDSTNQAANLFTFDESVSLNPKGRIHTIDITNIINPNDTEFTLYTPTHNLFDTNTNNPNPLYVAFTLYLEYRNSLNTKLSSSIVLNDVNSSELIDYDILNLPFINNNYPVGLALSMGKLASNIGDGSFIYVNNDSLGLVHGTECCRPSGWGIIGQYDYYNNNLFGTGDDAEDNVMDSTDLLSNIQSNVSYGDTQINLVSRYQSPNVAHLDATSNPIWSTFLTYSTKCDRLHSYAIISDTTICAGEPLELKVGGDSTYSYTWRYKGNVISVDSIININPEYNRLYSILVSDTSGCSKTEIINIKVNEKPSFELATSDAICPSDNGNIVISNAQGIAPPFKYSKNNEPWQTAPVYGSLSEGNYTIEILDTNNCVMPEQVTINSINNTIAGFDYSTPLPFVPTDIVFNNDSQNSSEYQWFVNGTLVTNTTNLEQPFEQDGEYTITLVASKVNEQCTDTLTKTIQLDRENYLYIPTSFGKENSLTLFSSGYVKLEFRLVNSLGQVVTALTAPIISGEQNLLDSKNLARGVYFYEIKATKENGEEVLLGGKVVSM